MNPLFRSLFGDPTPENLAQAIMSIGQAIEKAGGSLGKEDSTFPDPAAITEEIPVGTGDVVRQFQISVAENGAVWDATVSAGIVDVPIVSQDSSGFGLLSNVRQREDETLLAGLADDSEYGVWMVYELSAPRTSAPLEHGTNPYKANEYLGLKGAGGVFISQPYTVAGIIKTSSAYKNPENVGALVLLNAANGYHYIGKISIAAGVVTIDQWQEDCIQLPPMTWAHGTIDPDTSNAITSRNGAAYSP